MQLTNEELLHITGGGISATMINAVARGVNYLLDFGRTVGSAIRRGISGKICPV